MFLGITKISCWIFLSVLTVNDWYQLRRHARVLDLTLVCRNLHVINSFVQGNRKVSVHLTITVQKTRKNTVPYFPAYNARVIYTKRIRNRKKWTCTVYIRKISDR